MTQGLKKAVYEEGKGFLSPIEDVVEDVRNGRMIILVDAEDRENEGDLVIPAQMATPDAVNFMAKFGRGLICLSLTKDRADELRLDYMTRHNKARNRTAFTVSIEAREGISTGISAADRSRTIATAIDPTKGSDDIVSPGHIFPLIARDGGVLVRAGHTEAAIDISRAAGLYPAGVICEIMNDDGSMARLPDLVSFAQRHGLKIGTIEDLIAYRMKNDSIVNEIARTTVNSVYGGDWDMHVYRTTVETVEHIALIKGDIRGAEPVLVRVHASNLLSDLLGVGTEGEGEPLIRKAMETIAKEGRGVLVIIRDAWPRTVSHKLKPRLAETPETHGQGGPEKRLIEIGVGSQILLDLGVRDMVLMSNTTTRYVGLEGYGLTIVGQRGFD